jgi:hypothetical protein
MGMAEDYRACSRTYEWTFGVLTSLLRMRVWWMSRWACRTSLRTSLARCLPALASSSASASFMPNHEQISDFMRGLTGQQ